MKLWLNVREGAEYARVCRDTIYTALPKTINESGGITGGEAGIRMR